jgi:hypothetical protein
VAAGGRRNADELLATALAAGKTVRDAAAAAGVSERTAYRRQEDEAFLHDVAALRSAMIDTAAGRLADGMAAAADVLRALLTANDDRVRLAAASKLIDSGLKLREVVELEEELAMLMKQVAAIKAAGQGSGR